MDRVFGIDISTWQNGIDLAKAKQEGVQFTIIRAGFTGASDLSKYIDDQFEKHYKNAKDNGLKVGAYWFSRATSYEKGKEEAEYMYEKCLKGKKFEYPIAIDVEDTVYQFKASKSEITESIKGFCEYIESKGYYVSIYSNINWFNNHMNLSELTKYDKWIAYWGTKKPSIEAGIWQFGGENNMIRSNKIANVTCDQDYAYKDYPTIMKNLGLNGFNKDVQPTPEPILQKFNIGDDVIISGNLYKSSDANEASGFVDNKKTKITRYAKGTKHPYNTIGDLGWMNENDIKLNNDDREEFSVNDEVKIVDNYASSSTSKNAIYNAKVGTTCYIGKIYDGRNFPYQLVTKPNTIASKDTIGFANKQSVKKL